MANAILLNQTNFTKDNILSALKISNITIDENNSKLTINYIDDKAENKEISLPLVIFSNDLSYDPIN